MKKSEITNKDLLQAIQKVDQKIDLQKEEILTKVDEKIDEVLWAVNKASDDTQQSINKVENDLKDVKSTIKTQMVTKTYLDEAFATFGLEQEKKHKRVNTLTTVLTKKKILNQSEAQTVLSI